MQSFHHLTPEVDCFVRQWGGGGVSKTFFHACSSEHRARLMRTISGSYTPRSSLRLKLQRLSAFRKFLRENGENGAGKKIWDWCISLTRTREELCANAREVIHEGSLI